MEEEPLVEVNRQTLSVEEARLWLHAISDCQGAQLSGDEVKCHQYWYDNRCGLWGRVGGPIEGMTEPKLPYIKNTCEGNWSTKWDLEQYTPTNVWVNNREVHVIDLDHFKRLRLPITSVPEGSPAAFWIIDENGEVLPEPDMSRGYIEEISDRSVVKVIVNEPTW
eukprot:CAMPEP_0117016968 /NCGR_PEP_ID=MMETSP0472-20121206/13325_1 /TAXON_ID=693140 ORGANISM="Tiarina fusus, Strain LIS" /NCGR_SAMPLE_ID=MMETSP0472 /ASSEMBLY_ACC=CAM_ASM_000603 /LENGTH=164 /DNA_ID=CAMNT_0004721221 /DNA_START=13 /DNA_END=504 /DNA_ORIENTATION=-